MTMKHLSRTISVLLSICMLVTCLLPAAFAEQPSAPQAVEATEGFKEDSSPAEPTQAPAESEQPQQEPTPLPSDAPDESEPPVPTEQPADGDTPTQTEQPAQTEQPEDDAPADPLQEGEEVEDVEDVEEIEDTPEFVPYYAQPEDALPLFAAPELDGEPFGTLAQGVVYVADRQDETALYIQYAEAMPETELEAEAAPELCGAWVDAALLTPLTPEQLDEYTLFLSQTEQPLCYADDEQTVALLALTVEYPTQEEDDIDLLAQQDALAMADAPALTSIRITGAGSISKNGGTAQLTVLPIPATATLGTVVWSVTEPSGLTGLVADISGSGLVTAKGNGRITVTATVEGTTISKTKTISISRQVVPTTGITLSAPATTLIVGKTMVITPTYAPLTATDKKLSWTVTQGADYASVSSSGKVSLKAKAFTDEAVNVVIRAALKSDPENIYADYALTAYPKPKAVTLDDRTTVTLYLYQNDETKNVPTVTRTATITPSVLSACDEILWKSSNKKVATVDAATGLVTALKAGKATITAYSKAYSSVKAAYIVTVAYPVQGITLAGKNGQSTLLEGKSLSMQATLSPKNATNKKLSWEIKSVVDASGTAVDPYTQVVTLSKSGVLRAYKNTTTATLTYPLDVTVRATALGADPTNHAEGIGYAETTIKIWRPVATLTITAQKAIIDPSDENKTLQLDVAYGATEAQVQQGVTWTSSNKKVATVDENGLVTATGKIGTATITAKAKDGSNKTARLVVRVGTPVSEITLTGDAAVAKTKSITLKAALTPTNATVKKLTWTTSDKTIATVSSSGKVTGKKEGTVTITATAADGSYVSASKEITVLPLPTSISMNHSLTADPLLSTRYLAAVGTPVTITATILPDNAAQAVTWRSSSTAVATVTATGTDCVVTPNKVGTATITATTVNGKAARIIIRVMDAKAYAAPTGLSAEEVSSGTVKLAWQHADSDHKPSRYAIYRQNDDKKTWSEVATTVLTECTLTRQPKGEQVYSVVPQMKITGTRYEDGKRATFETVTVTYTTVYRALLVAQSNYASGSDLLATPYDVNAISDVLKNGETPYSVTKTVNYKKAQILSAITSTFKDATEDDVSLFFYSGHGASTTSASNPKRGALCTVEGNSITGSELASALSKVPGKVIVILESCFSGNLIWDDTTMSLTQDDATVQQQQEDANAFNNAIIDAFSSYDDMTLQSGELLDSKFCVLTAAAYDQSGMEIGWFSNSSGAYLGGFGFLTYCLTEGTGYAFSTSTCKYEWKSDRPADTDSNSIVTLSEAYTYAASQMPSLYSRFNVSGTVQQVQTYPAGSTQPLFFKKK